jgi:hypothetical protein
MCGTFEDALFPLGSLFEVEWSRENSGHAGLTLLAADGFRVTVLHKAVRANVCWGLTGWARTIHPTLGVT